MATGEILIEKQSAVGWRNYYDLTKPKVVALILFTALVGMLLSVPGAVPLQTLCFGLLGIALVYWTSALLAPGGASTLVVASMGASAVLLFAVPHGPLSQPWALIGGHMVSAFIGVSCATLVPDTITAAALAVGLAIGAMHLLRCIHPPGGATALAAVVSGPSRDP